MKLLNKYVYKNFINIYAEKKLLTKQPDNCPCRRKIIMKKIKKKQHNIRKTIIMMTLSFLLIFLINNCLNEIYDVMDSIGSRLDARRLVMTFSQSVYNEIGEKIEEYLKENSNIIDFSKSTASPISVFGLREDYHIWGVDTFIPAVLKEYMITDIDELKDDEIIIAKYITEDSYDYPTKTMDYIDGEQYIGRQITCTAGIYDGFKGEELDTVEYTFKIVGVFDNITSGQHMDAYVSENITRKMTEEKNIFPDNYEETEDYYRYEPTVELTAFVKDYNDINTNERELEDICREAQDEMHMVTHIIMRSEGAYLFFEGIRLLGNMVGAYLIIRAAMNVYLYIRESLEKRKREFGILKAIGYNSGQISITMLKEAFLCICISLGVTFGVGNGIFAVINHYIRNNFNIYWNTIKLEMDIKVNLIILSVGVLVPMFGYIFSFAKIRKLEPMEALR